MIAWCAGIEQTAHAVGFVLYLLAKNPVAQNKLLFELRDEKVGASWAKGTVLHQLG
jgi:cytochrome P450